MALTEAWALRSLTDADRPAVNAFLARQFGPVKGAFLRDHGAWWHQGDENRRLVTNDAGTVSAYFATTPACCLIDNQPVPTLWWIDLVVDPTFRRQGLQRLMDESVRERPGLKLGIPNAFHAKILAQHGWYVRADTRKYLLPLRLSGLRQLQQARGWRRFGLRLGVALAAPAAALWRRYWRHYRPITARATTPDPAALAAIAARHPPTAFITICRTESFFRWRYLESPSLAAMRFYVAGPAARPTHYLITRDESSLGPSTTRILDLYGDFEDGAGVRDIVRLALHDAVQRGAAQVTLMAGPPVLKRHLRQLGFWLGVPVHVCFHSTRLADVKALAQQPCYWTFADSDNDTPE